MKRINLFMLGFAAFLMIAGTTAVAQDTVPAAKQDTVKTDAKPKEEAKPKKEKEKKDAKKKKDAEVSFEVNMTCENCKARIEKHITWEKGVKDLNVNLDRKLVTVKFDPKKTDEAALQKAIEDLNYTAKKVEEEK